MEIMINVRFCGSSHSFVLVWPTCKCYSRAIIDTGMIRRFVSVTFIEFFDDLLGSLNPISPFPECPTNPGHIPSGITHDRNNVHRSQVGEGVIFVQLSPGGIDALEEPLITTFFKA